MNAENLNEFRRQRLHAASVCRQRVGDWNREFLGQLQTGRIRADEVGCRDEVFDRLHHCSTDALQILACRPFPLLTLPPESWYALPMPELLPEPVERSEALVDALVDLVLTVQHIIARDRVLATMILHLPTEAMQRIELVRTNQMLEWARRVDSLALCHGRNPTWWDRLLTWSDDTKLPNQRLLPVLYTTTVQFAPYMRSC